MARHQPISRQPFAPSSKQHRARALGRVVQTKQAVHIEDVTADRAYLERDPIRVSAVDLGGVRTVLGVPMLKNNEVIGAIGIYREVVRPFTDRHIGLVTNFAAQAVIAIENARLLNELRQRTTDLTERTADLTEALPDLPSVLPHIAFRLSARSSLRHLPLLWCRLNLLRPPGKP